MIRTASFLVIAILCALSMHAARAQDAADLVTRLNRLEGMLRDLTGQVEQLQYRNQQLTQQVQRLQDQLQGGAPAASAAPPRPSAQYAPPQYSPPPPQYSQAQPQYSPPPAQYSAPPSYPAANAPPQDSGRHDAFNPALSPNAPGAPRSLGTSTTATEPPPVYDRPQAAVDAPGSSSGPRQPGAPLNLSSLSGPQGAPPGQLPPPPPTNASATGSAVATLPPTNSPKDEYDLAYGYFLHKDYQQAAQTFGAFLHKYPSDRLTPEAQYWLGESLFQNQQFHDAAEAFLTVSTKYETTGRAPDALLRLGQSLAALGEKEAACASLGEVLHKYPRASLSVKQNVEREQKRAHC
ncbi:MAG TPA: tol-pal system protein YbgF [Xanthobacteraceae bacterium]|nr:tol-pal system protein YbgF [Xanthobacteraceae bacterium]